MYIGSVGSSRNSWIHSSLRRVFLLPTVKLIDGYHACKTLSLLWDRHCTVDFVKAYNLTARHWIPSKPSFHLEVNFYTTLVSALWKGQISWPIVFKRFPTWLLESLSLFGAHPGTHSRSTWPQLGFRPHPRVHVCSFLSTSQHLMLAVFDFCPFGWKEYFWHYFRGTTYDHPSEKGQVGDIRALF